MSTPDEPGDTVGPAPDDDTARPEPAAPSDHAGGLDDPGLPERAPTDWVALAMGPLALVFSLLTFYTGTASARGLSVSQTWNAWHGVFGWLGALVAFAASVLVALELFAPGQVALRWPPWRTVAGLFAAAVLCYLVAWFVTPIRSPGAGYSVHFGRGIGFYGGLVFAVVGLAVALLQSRPHRPPVSAQR